MPDAKRPNSGRRTPASRPGRPGEASGRPRRASPIRRDPRAPESKGAEPKAEAPDELDPDAVVEEPDQSGVLESIKTAIADAAEQQSEQRFGATARRAAILAAVICVLTLTIAGPVRTYFAQRAEMQQLAASEARLRSQIADLEQQKAKLGDPVYIAAQARERLGFVMPGDIPYQVQLPPGAVPQAQPSTGATQVPSGQPWYTSLWHTIADAPHPAPGALPAQPPVPGPPPAVPPGPTPGG